MRIRQWLLISIAGSTVLVIGAAAAGWSYYWPAAQLEAVVARLAAGNLQQGQDLIEGLPDSMAGAPSSFWDSTIEWTPWSLSDIWTARRSCTLKGRPVTLIQESGKTRLLMERDISVSIDSTDEISLPSFVWKIALEGNRIGIKPDADNLTVVELKGMVEGISIVHLADRDDREFLVRCTVSSSN